ncbi:hypothetical protein CRYUN_Cryun02cG0064500 [Craigia yunnanensis]
MRWKRNKEKKKENVAKRKEKEGEHRAGTINYVASLSATRGTTTTRGTRVEKRGLGPQVVPSSKHAPRLKRITAIYME